MTKSGESKSILNGAARRAAVLVMAIALLAGASATAFANTTGSTIVVNIPFAFTVGSSSLPAGEYVVTDKGNDVIQIQGSDANVIFRAWKTRSGEASKRATVVFNRYGDRYFLSGLQTGDGARLVRTGQGNDEERLAKSGAKPKVVTVARTGR